MRARVPLRLTVIVGLLACCSTALAAPQYTATRLDPVDTLWVRVNGINASGQVVAEALTSGAAGAHAVVVSVGTMTDLGTLGGTWSSGRGINDSGQVVGVSSTSGDTEAHAFLYSAPLVLPFV